MVLVTRGVFVPEAMTTALGVNIPITIGLPIYGNGVPIQQPIRVNSYPWPIGESLRGLLNGDR